MDEWTAFVKARLDEDEAAAKAVTFRSRFTAIGSSVQSPGGIGHPAMPIADVIDPETAAHIARHDPARVLREVAAMRAILELARHANDLDIAVEKEYATAPRDLAADPWHGDLITQALAATWSDHPEYPAANSL
jgi:hypothetical protein